MPLCQLCERLDWATAQQFRPLKGSALGAPARTGDAGGVPASTEHPFEPESLGRYRSPSPAAAKLLARQQGPRRCLPGHRYTASNRAGL